MMSAPKELISEVWRLKDREDDWKGLVDAQQGIINALKTNQENVAELYTKTAEKYKKELGLP